MLKRLFTVMLCLGLLLCALPVSAADDTIAITGLADFLDFAQRCRLDTGSQNLTVILKADIDFSDTDFAGVPSFSGTFEGNHHTISGFSLQKDGSVQGLFRYLTQTAVVKDLNVEGNLNPGGSRSQIGGIAGSNQGQILGCRFAGTVTGSHRVGGIAGSNGVTGIIENCAVEGNLSGDHFAGGIAGENLGVIRLCTNRATLNNTPRDNRVELTDITVDSLTGTEGAYTVTDIGGIAGISSGVIRSCENHGNIGHTAMGYNIGGIAGSQSGYLTDCRNYGSITGRKEIGGIVGQLEPVSFLIYSEDSLQALQGQLQSVSGLVSQATGNAQASGDKLSGQLESLQDQVKSAYDAVENLLPDEENPQLPDPDTLLAAQNTLTEAMQAMQETSRGMVSSTQSSVSQLSRDITAISGQLQAMGQSAGMLTENVGVSFADISDQDTPEILTGKVESCANYGTISADRNAGGIAGAMAMENDLDMDEDWEQLGQQSLNFQGQLRAVITGCQNSGNITVKKQNAGGITGWQLLGLVKDCTNTGNLQGENADYLGGITGLSTGYIRSSYARCQLSGQSYLGGIAGSATIITDSLAQAALSGNEKLGAVAGNTQPVDGQTELPVSGNYYLAVDTDPGAIDGISYAGLAESVRLEDFLNLPQLPQAFRQTYVRFWQDDTCVAELALTPGQGLTHDKIPAVPQKDGYAGIWEGLQETDLSCVLFDLSFTAAYTPYRTVVETAETRQNEKPLMLFAGRFTDQLSVQVTPSQEHLPADCVECWQVTMTQAGETARFLLPEDTDGADILLLTEEPGGSWQETSFRTEGSYIVFSAEQPDFRFAITHAPADFSALYLWAIIGVCLVVLVIAVTVKKRKATHPTAKTE